MMTSTGFSRSCWVTSICLRTFLCSLAGFKKESITTANVFFVCFFPGGLKQMEVNVLDSPDMSFKPAKVKLFAGTYSTQVVGREPGAKELGASNFAFEEGAKELPGVP